MPLVAHIWKLHNRCSLKAPSVRAFSRAAGLALARGLGQCAMGRCALLVLSGLFPSPDAAALCCTPC